MRSCTQARRLFGPYWDDETTQAERDWLEHHFQSCEPCRVEYESFTRTIEAVGSLPRHEAAPDLLERALAAARRATTAPDRLAPVEAGRRWVPMTAAAALLVLFGAMVAQVLPTARETRTLAARPTGESIMQPTRVSLPGAAPNATGAPGPAATGSVSTSPANAGEALAALPDSLFDHSEDMEFILDPVTLRRGRAHTMSRLPQGVQGEQAVITF